MIKKNSLLYNNIVFGFGSIGTKAIQFLLIPVLTSFMTPNEFGKIDYYNSFILLLVPIVSLSVADGVIRFGLKDHRENKKKVIGNILTLLFIFSILLILGALILFSVKKILFAVLTIYLLAQISNQIILSFLKVLEFNMIYAFSGVISALLQMGTLIFIFNMYSHSIQVYFMVTAVVLFIVNTILLAFIKFQPVKIDFNLITSILKYSIPLIPNVLLWWIMNFSDRFFIKFFLGFSATGYYSLATKFPILINSIMLIFLQAWQIELFKFNDDKINKVLNTATEVFKYFNYLFLVVLIPFTPYILPLLANSEYDSSINYVPLLLMATVYSNLSMFVGTNYLVAKETNKLWMTAIVGTVVNTLLNVLLIPLIGVNGAGLATLISYMAVYLTRYFDQRNKFNLKIDWIRVSVVNLCIIFQVIVFTYYRQFLFVSTIMICLVVAIILLRSIKQLKYIGNNYD